MLRRLAWSAVDLRQGASGWARALLGQFSDPALRQNTLAAGDQVIVSATGFLTLVLLGRHSTPDQLGLYALASSVVVLIRSVQDSIVLAPYTVYCHRQERSDLASYAGSTLVQQLFICALALAGLGFLASGLLLGTRVVEMAPVFWVLLVVLPAVLMREFARQMAFAHLETATASILDLTVGVIQVGALLLLAGLGRLSAASAYWSIGVACGLAAAAWTLARRAQFSIRPELFGDHLRRNWSFGKWVLAGQFVGSSMSFVMPWLLALYQGTAATGLLAASGSVVGVSNMLLLGVSNVLSPRAAKAYVVGGAKELRHVLRQAGLLLGGTLGVFAAALWLFGDPLARFLYGGRYAGAGPVIGVLAMNALAASFGVVAGNGLWALGRPSANFKADIIGVGVALGAALYLVPSQGALGVALALLAGAATGAAVRCWTLGVLLRPARALPAQGQCG
jgi:O-antigen/teichoic acid export membrane protein